LAEEATTRASFTPKAFGAGKRSYNRKNHLGNSPVRRDPFQSQLRVLQRQALSRKSGAGKDKLGQKRGSKLLKLIAEPAQKVA
jgi:hypothetical protein